MVAHPHLAIALETDTAMGAWLWKRSHLGIFGIIVDLEVCTGCPGTIPRCCGLVAFFAPWIILYEVTGACFRSRLIK